jgi:UDP-3-O-[3-hydroxymyristoyl] glucosamine N-acyltransferase
MSKHLYIIGAKYAHNSIAIARDCGYKEILLVDDNEELHGKQIGGCMVVGGVDKIRRYGGFVCCVGDTINRYNIVQRALMYGRPVNLIHPSAIVDGSIGIGNIVCQNAVVQVGSTVGDFCYIHACDVIGPYCKIGSYVNINSAVCISSSTHVGDFAYLGVHCTTLQWSKIGAGATVGASALIPMRKEVAPFSTVVGIPFKEIKSRISISMEYKTKERYENRPIETDEVERFGWFEEEYFEGDKGYGGYEYDEEKTAEVLRKPLSFINDEVETILDVGCAKGFALKYLSDRDYIVSGIDISKYAVSNKIHDKVGLGTYMLSKLEIYTALQEIERVSKNRSFIRVKAWRNDTELAYLKKWEPNIKNPLSYNEWLRMICESGYKGSVEFVFMGVEDDTN